MMPLTGEQNDDANVGARVATGASMLVGAQLLLRLFSILSTAILARLLAPEDYGILALGLVVIGLAQVLSDIGMGAAIIRMREVRESHFDTAFTLQFLRGLLLAAIIFSTADLAARFLESPNLAPVLRWLALAPLLDGLKNPRFILFERRIDFSRELVLTLASTLGTAAVTISLAFVWQSYWALIAGTLAGRAINLVLSYVMLPTRPGFGLGDWREFVSFGGWLMAANILSFLNYKSDTVLLGKHLGPSMLGQYTMGDQIATIATNELAGPFTRAIYPGLAAVSGNRERLRQAYYKAQTTVLGFVLPIGVGTALVARDFVLVLAGDKWLQAIPVVQTIAPIMAIGMLTSGVHAIAMTSGDTKGLFYRAALNFAIRVPAIVIGLFMFGFMGLLYARMFSGLVNTALSLQLVSRVTGDWFGKTVVEGWRSLAAVAVMSAAVLLVKASLEGLGGAFGEHLLRLALQAGTGALVYVLVHYLLWRAVKRPDGFERFLRDRIAAALQRLASVAQFSRKA